MATVSGSDVVHALAPVPSNQVGGSAVVHALAGGTTVGGSAVVHALDSKAYWMFHVDADGVTLNPSIALHYVGGQFVPVYDGQGAPTTPPPAGLLKTYTYPSASPLLPGQPWEQVQLPKVRGVPVPRINGLTSGIPGVAGPSGLPVPSSAMKVELFDHSHNDVTVTATAAAAGDATTIQLNTGTVPVAPLDFMLNQRTQEKLRVASSYVSGTSVPVIRGTQGYTQVDPDNLAATAIQSGDTFLINGGDVSDSGGNYDTSRSEVRGRYATPGSTVPSAWPDPVGSVRFYHWQIMLPSSLFPTPTGTQWVTLFQVKGQFGGSPPVSIEASTAGTFKLQLGATADVNFGNLTRGVWHDIVLGVKLSPDPAVGWVEVWFEKTNVIARFAVATMEYQSGGVIPDPIYIKQGIYRLKDWITGTGHTCYVSPLEVATSGAPFGAQV